MKLFLPSGSQDDFGNMVTNRNRVFENFRNVITLRGYKEISTPVIEYATTFTSHHVGMPLQNMLKWFNNEGEIEVLRPDWTTAIARAIGNQRYKQKKWAYQGSVFQRNKPGVENRQVGIEIIDLPNYLGESECLFMANQFLSDLKIQDYLIEIGHTGIFEELTNSLDLTEDEMSALRLAMHDKRKDEVFQLALQKGSIELAHELTSLVDAFGSIETILTQYEDKWKNRPVLLEILQHLKNIHDMLKEVGIKDVIVDLGRVKNLPYYSGIMFRGFLKENGATCFSGGRYDKLYDQFGGRISAIGLAFDVDVLAEQLKPDLQREKICIVATDETITYAESLRSKFKESIVDIQFEAAVPKDYQRILYIKGSKGSYEVLEK